MRQLTLLKVRNIGFVLLLRFLGVVMFKMMQMSAFFYVLSTKNQVEWGINAW